MGQCNVRESVWAVELDLSPNSGLPVTGFLPDLPYFSDSRMRLPHPTPNLGRKWGCVLQSKCSLPGSLGAGGGGGEGEEGSGGRVFFFPYFPPLKPRYVIWSGVSYSPKNTVFYLYIGKSNTSLGFCEYRIKLYIHSTWYITWYLVGSQCMELLIHSLFVKVDG